MQGPYLNNGSMLQVLKIFFNAERTKPWLVLLCLVVGSMLEAFGISSLMPVANVLLGGEQSDNVIASTMRRILDVFGLEMSLGNLLLLVSITMLLRCFMLFGAMSYAGWTTARVITGLREKLIKSVFEANWNYYVSQNSGALASAISSDAQRAGDAYALSASVVAYIVQVLGYCAIAFILNWKVALFGIGAGALIAISTYQLVQASRRAGLKLTKRTSVITEDMLDLLKNIKPLKAMNRYDPLITELSGKLKKLKRAIVQISLSRYGLTYGSDALLFTIIAAAIYAADRFAEMKLPELTVFGLLFLQIVSYVTKLQKHTQSAVATIGSHEVLAGMIAKAQLAKEEHTGTEVPDLRGDVKFSDVSFAHDSNQILASVSFDIPTRKITVLSGPSGAGKTTIIDLFTALYKPNAGHITLSGTDLSQVDIGLLRDKIGYVAQDLILFHDTIRNNVSLGEDGIADEAIKEALHKAGALSFVEAMPEGLDTDVGEHGGKLSGGQRQRIALARALIGEPEILILDEVTSALDPESEAEIIRNISGLRAHYTIIAITHRPAWKDIADRLYLVSGGQVTRER
jgi:ATP-binding cassette, subfamily C, bacterial